MTHIQSRIYGEDDSSREVTEQIFRVAQRVETMRRQAGEAQQAAADSFDKSADSHDRTASSYEKLANRATYQNDYLEHAARHRDYAQEDHRIAQRLRQISEYVLVVGARPD